MARLQEFASTRGNRMLLGLALAAGAVAAVLVFVALSQGDDEGGGTVAGGGDATVVVAAQDINAGTVISSDLVTTVQISEDQLISGAATDASVVVGEAARVKIYKGEQLATGKVGAENDTEGASGVIPPGMRGFSVGVEEVRAVGGLLRPGNRVDVYAASIRENDKSTVEDDEVISRLVLQDIEVLAVAQEAQEPAAAQTDASSGTTTTSGELPDDVDEQPAARSITLVVTPEQAAILICAQENRSTTGSGTKRVWLSLRGFGEAPAAEHTVVDVCHERF